MNIDLQNYLNSICCSQVPITTTNFDITGNWATGNPVYPVTDQGSFEAFLNSTGAFSNMVITDFTLINNRLRCNITANGGEFQISGSDYNFTEVLGLGNIIGLSEVYLSTNQLTVFKPIFPLPDTLTILDLNNNQMTLASYTAMEDWANDLPFFTNGCEFWFSLNPDSPIGTNLETILNSKNVTLIY